MPERRRLMARTKKDRPALTGPVHPQETTQEEPVTNHTTHTTPPLTAYTVDEAMHSLTIAAQDLIHDWSDTRVRGHLKEPPDLVEHRLNLVTQMTDWVRAVVQRERGDGRWGGPLEDIDPAEEHAEEVAEHMDHECDCPYCLGQAPQQPLHEATAVEQARALLAGTSHAVVPVTHLNASQRRIAELEEQVGRMVEGGWVDPDVLREQGRAELLEAMVGRVDGDE